MTTPDRATVTVLYRYFDASGRLLYVGITDDPVSRGAAHRRTSPWYPQVADMECDFYLDSRAEAEKDEALIIRSARPLYNRQHSDTPMNVTRDFPVSEEVTSGQLRNRMADVINSAAVRQHVTYVTSRGRRVAAVVPVEAAEVYEATRSHP